MLKGNIVRRDVIPRPAGFTAGKVQQDALIPGPVGCGTQESATVGGRTGYVVIVLVTSCTINTVTTIRGLPFHHRAHGMADSGRNGKKETPQPNRNQTPRGSGIPTSMLTMISQSREHKEESNQATMLPKAQPGKIEGRHQYTIIIQANIMLAIVMMVAHMFPNTTWASRAMGGTQVQE